MPNDEPIPELIPDLDNEFKAFPNWPDWTPRDNASLVLPQLDYESQLLAIKVVLRRNTIVDKQTDETVEALNQQALQSTGIENQRVVEEWVDTLHNSTYQSAALSMSALGMLAPLYESLFSQAFSGIRNEFVGSLPIDASIRRLDVSGDEFWDSQKRVSSSGDMKTDVYLGTEQLAKAIGLYTFIPSSLWNVFKALLAYRNKMFHNGFEWPENICENFAKQVQVENWDAWFSTATTNDKPWMFYMTQPFIAECLENLDGLLDAIGRFVDVEINRQVQSAQGKRSVLAVLMRG